MNPSGYRQTPELHDHRYATVAPPPGLQQAKQGLLPSLRLPPMTETQAPAAPAPAAAPAAAPVRQGLLPPLEGVVGKQPDKNWLNSE